ncbi:MAG: hypothetical protein AM325_010960 [Candidatus Thorarchaeota archaeon SMTZ1-45]|nr:MAG: hypothetical protein AM325_12660 [Candidatus Thorarchaeota archaeon SMTZ1-45]
MNEKIDLVKLEQATFRTANQDGFTELWMGLMILAISLLLIHTAFVGTVAILIIFQAVFNEKIKEKFTYPRIGKVKLRGEAETPSGYGWILAVLIMIPALASVFFSTVYENDILYLIARGAPVLVGIGLIQPSAYLVSKSGLNRYYGIGIVSSILGMVFTLLESPTAVSRMTVYLVIVGGLFILVGIASLARFVRKYPILDLEEMGNEQ